MPIPQYIGRFAPSPTGPLHMGSLVTALASWWIAKQQHGKWLIRIEDIDPPREVSGAAEAQIECLKMFGMQSDEPILYQSQRYSRYTEILDQLLESGHAFECRCSRHDLAQFNGIHRNCVSQPTQSSGSIRLKIPEMNIHINDDIQGEFQQALGYDVGDIVLKRTDGFWAYQLAVVADDADQRITHVVRGADLLDSTPRQIYLQRLLALPSLKYTHLPLVLDSQGNKLSKSELSVAIDPDDPMPPLQFAWRHLGQDIKIVNGITNIDRFHDCAIAHFQVAQVPRSVKL
jgi:glutamyl-Q tRNA(Asp) synthetase